MILSIPGNILAIVVIVQTVWLVVLSILLIRALKHYQLLIGKTKKQNLKAILESVLKKTEEHDIADQALSNRCEEIEKKGLKHMQKVGFLRFNPFSDTGGDQSFVLSLLDGEDNGLILSSLHGRESTRIYAKAIKKGEGENLELSKEEQEAIKRAKRRKI